MTSIILKMVGFFQFAYLFIISIKMVSNLPHDLIETH